MSDSFGHVNYALISDIYIVVQQITNLKTIPNLTPDAFLNPCVYLYKQMGSKIAIFVDKITVFDWDLFCEALKNWYFMWLNCRN